MKTVRKILFLSLIMTIHFSYSMNKTEEEMFQENCSKLSEPLIRFVNDFKTWPKRDQEKIKIGSNSGGVSFVVQVQPRAAHKYDGSVGKWINDQLAKDKTLTIPFYSALDYINKQK